MANNVILNPGVGGDVIATEDIGGIKFELVKLVDSTPGSTTPTGTATNPLRVDPTGSTTQPVTANAGTNLNTSLLALEAGNLATLASKDFATQTSLASVVTNTAPLVTAQAASSAGVAGPMVQAVVSDVPNSFSIDTVQPLSMTAEGRLRVSAVMSQIDQVWQGTFSSPWFSENSWLESKGDLYV